MISRVQSLQRRQQGGFNNLFRCKLLSSIDPKKSGRIDGGLDLMSDFIQDRHSNTESFDLRTRWGTRVH